MDEIKVLTDIHRDQKRWRLTSKLIFLAILLMSTVIFVVFPREVPGIFIQILMIMCMFSIIGLVFLDRVSFQINKTLAKKSILSDYLFKHSVPEDIYKEVDIVVELIRDRRAAAQEQKRM